MAKDIILRPEVQWFAEQMELMLQANEYKGGWQTESKQLLTQSLIRNVYHLEAANQLLSRWHKHFPIYAEQIDSMFSDVMRRSANVANFAMMIADNAKNRSED
ncbi:hypothetical protein D3C87_1016800 [compost metagenome]